MIIKKPFYKFNNYILSLFLHLKWIFSRIIKRRFRPSIKVLKPFDNRPYLSSIPKLKIDENKKLLCNSCKICETVCPAQCVSIEGNYEKKLNPTKFSIDFKKCIFCMDCITYCPIDALELRDHNLLSITGSPSLHLNLDELRNNESSS